MAGGCRRRLWLLDPATGRPSLPGDHIGATAHGFGWFGEAALFLAIVDETGKAFALPVAEIAEVATFLNLFGLQTEAEAQAAVEDRRPDWLNRLVGRALAATAGRGRIRSELIGFDTLGRNIAGSLLKVAFV
jgi:hypothetical protein